MIKASTGLRNQMLDTASFQDIFTEAAATEIRIFSGDAPASADAAEAGTLLVTITKDGGATGLSFGAAADGAINKAAGTWVGTIAETGTAGYYRLVLGADDAQASTTAPRVQGEIGTTQAPKDLNLANLALEQGGTQSIDIFTIQFPTA